MSTALVLLRRDLRLADHPALAAACAAHARVLPVYVHDPAQDAPWRPGAASCWWLHHSLRALDGRLAAQGGRLHVESGDSLTTLRRLATACDAGTIYWTRRYEPAAIAQDSRLKAALRGEGLAVESHPGNLWREPWQVATASNSPYRIFTPYWRRLRPQLQPVPPLPTARARAWVCLPGSLPLEELGLLPAQPWAAGLAQAWHPGEAGAQEQLELFGDDALAGYAHGRDLPARHGTSRLSAHLHFGEITPRQIHHRLRRHATRTGAGRGLPDLEPYLRELGWREFAHHLLYHFPHTPEAPFDPRFDRFDWREDPAALERWQQGRTGVPLVDAGMRELWHTGWMHNRVRMVVASFLTKNLRQHWRHGARWFWDTLVDADLANNTLGWQWTAGCGADAAPFFRMFNPCTQAARLDPQATYLKRWLPELADLPARLLHEPWRDPSALAARGYPPPLVDLAASREEALAAWRRIAPA